jgi:hypothetical protein
MRSAEPEVQAVRSYIRIATIHTDLIRFRLDTPEFAGSVPNGVAAFVLSYNYSSLLDEHNVNYDVFNLT